MLLDPQTLDLAPRATEVLARVAGDIRFKPELPAAHLELITQPRASVEEAVRELAGARRDLLEAAGHAVRVGAAGVHPFAAVEGQLNRGPRYDHTAREFGFIAQRQLVASLQVHVAVGGADRTLAVYNALRSYLPEIAALAANAAFYEGRDSGLASVRPKVCEMLPRQGMAPAIESWDHFADTLAWGARSRTLPDPGFWWWELRPHLRHGTLEIRVPDAQATVEDAAGVAALARGLVVWLAERHDAGDTFATHDDWRIEENRWSAARYGVEGTLADLDNGERAPARERIAWLVDQIEQHDRDGMLRHTRALLANPAPARQRAAAASAGDGDGPLGVANWLADSYAPSSF